MSAKVSWMYEQGRVSQELEDGDIVWSKGFGDGDGKEACVMFKDGLLSIFKGHVVCEEIDDGLRVKVEEPELLATVQAGMPHTGRVMNQDGRMVLLAVHNLGISPPQYPDMEPAWN